MEKVAGVRLTEEVTCHMTLAAGCHRTDPSPSVEVQDDKDGWGILK